MVNSSLRKNSVNIYINSHLHNRSRRSSKKAKSNTIFIVVEKFLFSWPSCIKEAKILLYSAQEIEKQRNFFSSSSLFFFCIYSQTRIKCSQPISSLRGLQGHKIFAGAIIKILISTKSISDKNCYDQLFINKVVQIFTFQFDESVTKFYVAKVLSILMKFS